MSRLYEWMHKEREDRNDYSAIIDDKPTQFDVYRIDTIVDGVGFSSDIPSYNYVKKILARLENESKAYKKVNGESGTGVVYGYVAITLDTDVQIKDRWVDGDNVYYVQAMNLTDNGTEVKLKSYKVVEPPAQESTPQE